MTTNRAHLRRAAVLAVLVPCLTSAVVDAQESGTLLSQTLTLLRTAATPTMEFEVAGGANGKTANTTTKVVVEIGPDGNTAAPPPDPMLPNTVKFRLTKLGVANPAEFTPAGGSDNATFPQKVVVLSKGLEKPADPRGLYVLSIVHLNGVAANTTESWKLEITGLAAAFRANSSIDQGTFKSVAPSGPCAAPAPTCPQGQSCQSPCPPCLNCHFPWWKYVVYVVDLRWPFPPPDPPECPVCGIWSQPVPDGFDRVLVSVTPFVRPGVPLGPGKLGDVKFNIKDGEAVGPVFDAAGGQYMQLIQYRKGEPPRVSATAANTTTEERVAVPTAGGGDGVYRTLTYLFGVLLLIALAAIVALSRRGAPTGGGARP